MVAAYHDYERQLAATFAAGGRLNTAVAEAQRTMVGRLGYLGGHQVIASITNAQAHIGQAITSGAEGHRKLSRLGDSMGYRFASEFGDSRKDPKAVLSILLSAVGDEQRIADAH